jgi:hypothetical protein
MTSMGAGPVRWQRRESVLHAAARLGSPALCALLAVTHPQLLRAQATVRARTPPTPHPRTAQHRL